MPVNLPLAEMSVDDKLQAMELLDAEQQPWADLSQNPEQVTSPAWHGEVLRSRREQVQQGNASFQSWDAAIEGLRAELAG
jgi:hypothetical protein